MQHAVDDRRLTARILHWAGLRGHRPGSAPAVPTPPGPGGGRPGGP